MEKHSLANILNEILNPIGFKKKGNYWVQSSAGISKMVNLQKSQFSNCFYINYGYIINAIPLNGLMMHVFRRLSSEDIAENDRLKGLLNLENLIPDKERSIELKEFIDSQLVNNIRSVNTEEDLFNQLKELENLNNVPLAVKHHLGLL